MTINSLLKTLLNLKSCVLTKIELAIGNENLPVSLLHVLPARMPVRLLVYVRPYKSQQHKCPLCMKMAPVYDYKQKHESWWRGPNLGGIPTVLLYRSCRVNCREHGVHTEYLPWADGSSRFTKEFNDEVTWMAGKLSRDNISRYLGVSWETVGNCISSCLKRLEPDRSVRLEGVRSICVDETARKTGHNYITVVYDMDHCRMIWVHDGYGESVFREFCELLTPEQRDRIEVVAGDGARWINTCTEEYFPNATRCMDPFHVTQWAVSMLDDVRLDLTHKAFEDLQSYMVQIEAKNKLYAQTREETEKDIAAAEEEIRIYEKKRGRKPKRFYELKAYIQTAREVLAKQDENPAGPESTETSRSEEASVKSAGGQTEANEQVRSLSHSEIKELLERALHELEGMAGKRGRKPRRYGELMAYTAVLQALLEVVPENEKTSGETTGGDTGNARKTLDAQMSELWTQELGLALKAGITDAEKELKGMPSKGRHSARWHRLTDALCIMKGCFEKNDWKAADPDAARKGQEDLEKLQEAYSWIRGGKYALGKNPENLTRNQADRLSLIQNSFPDMGMAYGMKESLRIILHSRDAGFAKNELTNWIAAAKESGLGPLEELGAKIDRNKEYILNSIRLQANSSKSEATNTTIKALIAMARGFTNLDNLMDLIYLVCSDLVVPLYNRIQPTAGETAERRARAAALKRSRNTAKMGA